MALVTPEAEQPRSSIRAFVVQVRENPRRRTCASRTGSNSWSLAAPRVSLPQGPVGVLPESPGQSSEGKGGDRMKRGK